MQINIYPQVSNDPQVDARDRVVSQTINPTGCWIEGRGEQPAVAAILTSWLTSRLDGVEPATSGLSRPLTERLHRWSKNPARTNTALRDLWPSIQQCRATLDQLP